MNYQIDMFMSLMTVTCIFAIVLFGGSKISDGFTAVMKLRRLNAIRALRAERQQISVGDDAIPVATTTPEVTEPTECLVVTPDPSFWKEQFDPAVRHRTVSVGRKKLCKLVISDYSDGMSTGRLRTPTSSITFDVRVATGTDGDNTLLNLATSAAV